MIPTKKAAALWKFTRLPRFEGRARTIARYPGGVTLIFAENTDGSYEVTRIRGGKIAAARTFHNLPHHIAKHIDRRRSTRDHAEPVRP